MKRSKSTLFLVLGISFTLFATQGIGFAAPSPKASPKASQGKNDKAQDQVVSSANTPAANSGKTNSGKADSPKQGGQQEATSAGATNGQSGVEAKKSSNTKINPSSVAKGKVNALAQKAKRINSEDSPACETETKAQKKRVQNDPCSDFIVVFAPGLGRAKSDELVKQSNARVKQQFSSIFSGALVNGPLSKMQALANNPNVLVVEDDLSVATTGVQSSAPWGLDRVDQTNLPLNTTFDDQNLQGANSYAFVVDTGIDATNNDFQGRVASGFTAVNDGLGSKDCNGHGTHVAGIIGGATYGVAKGTNLVPVRVLDCTGSGTYSSVIAGLDWISANYTPGMAAVVNMSLGGPKSSTIDGAVATLISKGVNVVVAAGNSNADACNYSPSNVPTAVTVGATDSNDARASYSNFGSCLDLFAPGSAITSTWLGATGVNTISGTSMATPLVTGVIARFISTNAGLTPAQVASSIKQSSTKGVVSSAGLNSLNQLVYLSITPSLVSESPAPTEPVFKKVVPRGKKR